MISKNPITLFFWTLYSSGRTIHPHTHTKTYHNKIINRPSLQLKLFTAKHQHSLTNTITFPTSFCLLQPMAAVTSLVAENPVVIFSRNINCPMTHTVNSLITGFGANPVLYYLDRMPNRQQIESALAQLGRQQNQPAVFIGQQFIGGPTEVNSLLLRNELVPLLLRSNAIWVWRGA